MYLFKTHTINRDFSDLTEEELAIVNAMEDGELKEFEDTPDNFERLSHIHDCAEKHLVFFVPTKQKILSLLLSIMASTKRYKKFIAIQEQDDDSKVSAEDLDEVRIKADLLLKSIDILKNYISGIEMKYHFFRKPKPQLDVDKLVKDYPVFGEFKEFEIREYDQTDINKLADLLDLGEMDFIIIITEQEMVDKIKGGLEAYIKMSDLFLDSLKKKAEELGVVNPNLSRMTEELATAKESLEKLDTIKF